MYNCDTCHWCCDKNCIKWIDSFGKPGHFHSVSSSINEHGIYFCWSVSFLISFSASLSCHSTGLYLLGEFFFLFTLDFGCRLVFAIVNGAVFQFLFMIIQYFCIDALPISEC